MKSSGSSREHDPPGALSRRAMEAFDLLCGDDGGPNGNLGVAVSGGSDSLALLLLASDWGKARERRIAVATVDHGLRPEAAEEANQVGRICSELGVPHDVLLWQRTGSGVVAQAEARRARHALLAGWAGEAGIARLALGHTRDDRVETFLMRARQGSGWRGLAGPLPSGPSPVWPEGRGLTLVRPLLAFGREELREELRARGREWVEDPSNESERFERVRMRRLAGRMDAGTLEKALRVMDSLSHMRGAVMAEARAALGECAVGGGEARVRLERLAGLGSEARLRLVEALVMAAGGAEAFPRAEALAALTARLCRSDRFAGMTLAGAWVRIADAEAVVSQAPPRRGQAACPPPCWERAHALLADPGLAALAA